MAQRLHVLRAGKRAVFLTSGASFAKENVTRAMRVRLGLAVPLIAALLVAGCGGLGTSNGSLCPAPTLEPVTTPGGSGASVTYGFLIDRAYTGDAKRSPSYPWPQLPMTALDTVAGALRGLDLRPGDSVFGTWISHNSNDMREIFLPLSQVPKSSAAEYPVAPVAPKAPINQLECNDYSAKVRTYNTAAKEWQTKVNDIAQAAAAQDAQTVATFIDRTQAAIRGASPVQDPVGTDIYGGLAVAGGVFGANAGKHKLVLFSDITDTVANPGDASRRPAGVGRGLHHRGEPSDQGKGQLDWANTFKTLNARTPVFLPWAATTVDKIVEQLKATGR